eukprot:2824029-Pyramimonas_sp.AAC.1
MAAWPTHFRPQVLHLFDLLGQCDDARLGAELLGEAQLSSAAVGSALLAGSTALLEVEDAARAFADK